ncbi:hypothetical protein GH714_000382 [Hevea brasiliensis]|uniref:Protein kinase domain-containing protein n=1 Tax=Hevea brasiliensis TaxID=3981 RepID=A0A6A6NBD5_HEVBR|nr:hypothetical protein GH714_000382 [Hevea brasiliensis]
MAICNFKTSHSNLLLLCFFIISFFFFYTSSFTTALSFNFNSFSPSDNRIIYEGDSAVNYQAIQLTANQTDKPLTGSIGRATYHAPLWLWDKRTGIVTDFNTHFSFVINSLNNAAYGDGMAFFMAPQGSKIPARLKHGSTLGLTSDGEELNSTSNPFVAIEFDIFRDNWDPPYDHVGIDANSMKSVKNEKWWSDIRKGKLNDAWISYNSSTKSLSVVFTGIVDNLPVEQSFDYALDLRLYLPEWVIFGFTGATGNATAIHTICSWDFTSTLEDDKMQHWTVDVCLGYGLVVLLFILIGIIGLHEGNSKVREDESFTAQLTEQEFETATGAKMMSYGELDSATNNFDEKNKLGEGGFSAVYKGFLMFKYIAVKKFKRVSIHGLKYYASEVMITGKLKHENLIKLIGWCYEKEQLLLVFEYMPNLSLDYHLFKGTTLLKWVERYKIALGLASALHYMHQGCERCVLHRDIKSSNVLLDSNFNAKLADFGLARLVNHDAKSQTLEGWTNGYEAPECHQTGKSSKMSDVYSFGVVALEIACGRRAFVQMDDGNHERLVKWVWDHCERGNLLDAADRRLCGNFDENQMTRLMMVGLWCAHPGFSHRPSAGEALEVLKFNDLPPNLPSKFPEARYAPASAGPSFSSLLSNVPTNFSTAKSLL